MVLLCSLPPPDEGVRHKQDHTGAYIDANLIGTGTLYIAESSLTWVADDGRGSFALNYPSIALHAVSRDHSVFPHSCIYMMIEASLSDITGEPAVPPSTATNGAAVNGDAAGGDGESSEEEGGGTGGVEPETKITEIRFVPSDDAALESMFEALADCQQLHPDENDDFSDEEDGYPPGEGGVGDFFTSESGMEHLTPEGQATLARLSGMVRQQAPAPPGQDGDGAPPNGNLAGGDEMDFEDAPGDSS